MILRELREIDQATDDILIYGNDGADNQKMKTDTSGRPDIVSDNLDIALSTLKTVLDAIDANTNTLESITQSIRDQLDVVSSSRSSEATSQLILSALGELSGTNIILELQNLTTNTAGLATETTLIQVRDLLTTVNANLQTIIGKLDILNATDFATESTSTEILNTIGQESGTNVLSKLDQIDNTLIDLITPFPGISVSKFAENGGSRDLNINGSITPVEFIVTPNTGKIFYVHSITIVIEDIGMNFNKYGGILSLTNGVDFKIKQNGGVETPSANIKRNGDYYTFVNELIFESSTTDILVGKVILKQNSGTTVKLTDSSNEYIKVVINDNLTALDIHYVLIRGYEVDE